MREIRLKAGIAHGGTAASAAEEYRRGCLHLASRSFTQTSGCQFMLSLALLNTFLKAVIILHGPVGCGTCSIAHVGAMKTFKRLRSPGSEGLVFLNTNLSESDVIGGGEKKLKEAILFAEAEFKPELIMVAIGCVPSLIGDDVDSVADSLKGEIAAKVVPIHCAGFKTKVMATAYDDVYHGLLTRVLPPAPGSPESGAEEARRKIARSRAVNIINVTSMSRADELELARLVSALDLDPKVVVCYAGAEGIADSLASGLNVSVCGTHDDWFLEHLQKIHGMPFILDTMPVGPRNTSRWLRKIAGFFGRESEAESLIASEEAALEEAVAPFREGFRGKKAFLAGGELRVIVTAELLRYLGLEIAGIKGHHFDRFALPALEQLDGDGETAFLVATQQPFEHVNMAKRLRPDVFVGHSGGNNITAKLGIPLFPLFQPSMQYMGYAGAFDVARRLERSLANGSFNRNLAEKRPLPFRESWYAKSPFAYIKAGDGEEAASAGKRRAHAGIRAAAAADAAACGRGLAKARAVSVSSGGEAGAPGGGEGPRSAPLTASAASGSGRAKAPAAGNGRAKAPAAGKGRAKAPAAKAATAGKNGKEFGAAVPARPTAKGGKGRPLGTDAASARAKAAAVKALLAGVAAPSRAGAGRGKEDCGCGCGCGGTSKRSRGRRTSA
ncbi:MAG: nitrogenase component 1 [Deltaproteobacteria bacterium]|nr:nitrogenase component 1 [Deltaproteobacteria bacterium]